MDTWVVWTLDTWLFSLGLQRGDLDFIFVFIVSFGDTRPELAACFSVELVLILEYMGSCFLSLLKDPLAGFK